MYFKNWIIKNDSIVKEYVQSITIKKIKFNGYFNLDGYIQYSGGVNIDFLTLEDLFNNLHTTITEIYYIYTVNDNNRLHIRIDSENEKISIRFSFCHITDINIEITDQRLEKEYFVKGLSIIDKYYTNRPLH